VATGVRVAPAATTAGDPPVDPQIAYWHKLAQKRLKLLGARERRIVKLLTRLRGSVVRGRRLSKSADTDSAAQIICRVFGSHCREAVAVARCESTLSVYARNGDYWGLFQFGSFARAHYGFAWNAWTQARAAYRYYRDAGWSPWTCRP